MFPPFRSLAQVALALLACWYGSSLRANPIPAVGGTAPDFSLRTLDGQTVELAKVAAEGKVLLVVLRGWPGYQCPICTKQVHDLVSHAAEFEKRGVRVLMVYPGPADQLQAHAQEFLQDKSWPAAFLFVTDPDYQFTNAYGLRWSAPKETAYPSTFIIRGKTVLFARTSHTHGNRVDAAAALAALDKS